MTGLISWESAVVYTDGRAIAQAISRPLPTTAARDSSPKSGHVGFMVDEEGLGQSSSE
jgi:hypothetical protein